MKSRCGSIHISTSQIIFQVIIHIALIGAVFPDTIAGQQDFKGTWPAFDCPQCFSQKERQVNVHGFAYMLYYNLIVRPGMPKAEK